MKFKLVESIKELDEEALNEATLTSIVNNIITNLRSVGTTPHYLDNDKKFLLCTTPRGNTFCIPIEEQSRVNSTDYKKLRYSGNGTIINGEVYDTSGVHIGRAYYGVTTNHQHLDYNPNVYQYNRNNTLSGTPIDFITFINDIRAGRY